MKKTVFAAATALALSVGFFSMEASAQYVGVQARQASPRTSVADVLKNGFDEQRVTLRGTVIRHIAEDKYIFTDGTGEIRVDIDYEEWPKEPVNEKTMIEIVGKIDTDWGRPTEIDVKVLRIVR